MTVRNQLKLCFWSLAVGTGRKVDLEACGDSPILRVDGFIIEIDDSGSVFVMDRVYRKSDWFEADIRAVIDSIPRPPRC